MSNDYDKPVVIGVLGDKTDKLDVIARLKAKHITGIHVLCIDPENFVMMNARDYFPDNCHPILLPDSNDIDKIPENTILRMRNEYLPRNIIYDHENFAISHIKCLDEEKPPNKGARHAIYCKCQGDDYQRMRANKKTKNRKKQ